MNDKQSDPEKPLRDVEPVRAAETGDTALLAVLGDPRIEEAEIVKLLERLDLPASVLSSIAQDGRWSASERVRLRLAQHPHTPKRIALAAVRQLYLFDLVRLSLQPSAPADVRCVAEEVILARVPHLPVGEKLTLARRGPSRVAGAVLGEGHPQAVKLALANTFLSESQVLKVLAKPGVSERVIAAIAQHPKWSCSYNVRMALVRNPHTPERAVRAFLPDLTARDLRDVVRLESLAPHLRKCIRQELARRTGRDEKSAG